MDVRRIQFSTDFYMDEIYEFLLIPQAWTLGLEIVFYFIIPFIIKSKFEKLILVFVFVFSILRNIRNVIAFIL